MSLAYQCFLTIVLLLTGSLAMTPFLIRNLVPLPPVPLRTGFRSPDLWIVESTQGRWFLNGEMIPKPAVERVIRQMEDKQLVHYLPSDALRFEHVNHSLRWLRRLAPGSIVLEIPPQPPFPSQR